MDTLAKRLRFLRKERGLSQEELAELSGVEQSLISKLERGVIQRTTGLVALANALRGRPTWLDIGDGPMEAPVEETTTYLLTPGAKASNPALASRLRAGRATELIELENNPDYPAIRKVKFKLSAGVSGFAIDYDQEDHVPIVFNRQWYESRGLRPDRLFAVKVANGSMEPGLHHGDTVVVNTEATHPTDGVVFAVNYEGELCIKRLVRDEGAWWLSSDNPNKAAYPRKRMTEDCFIIGEIVHKQSEWI